MNFGNYNTYGNQNIVPMAPPPKVYNPYAPVQNPQQQAQGYSPAVQQQAYNPYNYQQQQQQQPQQQGGAYQQQQNQPNAYIGQNQFTQAQQQQGQQNQAAQLNNQQHPPQNVQGNSNPYIKQQNQPKSNEPQVYFPEHQKHLDQLKQRYPYQVVQPQFASEVGKKTIVNIDFDIPSFKIPIKIELDHEFPKSKPIIYLRKRYLQQNVNDSTLRVLYESNFRWEPNSTLLSLVTTTHQLFQQNPPFPDGLLEQIKEKKELIREQQERQVFASIDVAKAFPGYSQAQYTEVLKKSSFAENILALPEVENLKSRVADIAQFNVKTSSDLIDQQSALEIKKINIAELAQEFEVLKEQLQQQITISNNIKERFGDMSIIQALGQKIVEIEEESQNLRGGTFEEEVRRYKQNRMQYHILNTKREKLTNSN